MKITKTLRNFGIVLVFILTFSLKTEAQSAELQQLLLNIEKLTQFKAILLDMKAGYQIYQEGYGTISNLSKGNFNLHDVYLNGLLAISPSVKNYDRVAEVLSQQASFVSEYKNSFRRFRQSGTFSAAELNYFSNVYSQVVKQSLNNLEELTNIMTAGKLRMSDDDRLRAIDRIYNISSDQLQFVRYFNRQGTMLSLQRGKDRNDLETIKRLYR